MTEKIPMTAEGYSALEAQLKYCREVERPRIIQQLADARTPEDLAENVEYRHATELQSQNEVRIAELENKLARAEVIDTSKLSGETITFGATVTLVEQSTKRRSVWKIVGEPEANVKTKKISFASPLARALMGKKMGSEVEVAAPGGAKEYRVLSIEWN
jgi:transcription elongation factor GreA